jgi:outer membrane protein TolC
MNRLKQSLILAIITILGMLSVQAQTDTVYKFTLLQAQEYAITHYFQSKNAKLDIEIAKKKVWETTAIGLPQISASISGSYTPQLAGSIEQFSSLSMLGLWMYGADQALLDLTGDNQFGYISEPETVESIDPIDMKWSLNGTLTVSQLLFSGSYLVGLQSAKVYKNISELSNEKTELEVRELVSNSYFALLVARENKIILDSTYSNLLTVFNEMKAMFGQGFIEQTDLDQMEITVSNVKISLDMIRRMTSISELLLKTQVGIGLDVSLELSDNLNDLIADFSVEKLILANMEVENNIDYKLLDNQVKASELLLKLDKSAYLPDLAAFYQYQKEFNENAFTFTSPHIIGVSMNIPIFGSGSKMAKVSQKKLELEKSQNNRDQLANSLMLDFLNSKSALVNAKDKFETEGKNMELGKRIFKNALIKYSNGMISTTDLTQIQNQYFTAQSNYYNALQGLITAKNKLEKLLSNKQ